MKFDKKDVILSIGGVIASAGIAYLLYRLEQNNAAQAAANSTAQSEEIQSQLANQQALLTSLPSVSVPTITTPSTTVSSTDTSNQDQTSASDSALEAIITQMLASDQTPVTSQTSPQSAINQIPLPTPYVPPTVTIPTLNSPQTSQTLQPNSLKQGTGAS